GEDKIQARRPQNLSPKELEVLQLVTSGYSNAQIAAAMGVATTTVDSYKERIKTKFGLDTIVECVAHAVASDLVQER
ncbi:MAG: helix-turn-helix transcriptional regulator, partial [Bacteroidales bacterium]|nr:helix-turn-helix transcriptional regulator [Bacteroidales bacterium]